MNQSRFIKQSLGLIVGLCVQFVLGMWTNLFVTFPDTTYADRLWKFAASQVPIMLHIIVGSLLVIGSLALLVMAYRASSRLWKIGAGLGFGATVLAWIAGREFVTTQQDQYSLAMALFFLVAILAYAGTIFTALKNTRSD